MSRTRDDLAFRSDAPKAYAFALEDDEYMGTFVLDGFLADYTPGELRIMEDAAIELAQACYRVRMEVADHD